MKALTFGLIAALALTTSVMAQKEAKSQKSQTMTVWELTLKGIGG